MKKISNVAITGALWLLLFSLNSGCGVAGSKAVLEAFPPVKKNQVRHIIYLEDKNRGEENGFQVELIPGKTVETDGVNVYGVDLFLEPVSLQGWGYTYYQVSGKETVHSTMMAVPENIPTVEKFVAGTPLMVGYNSRLPIVIYSQEGVDIRYRVWTAGEMRTPPGTKQ